MITIQYLQQLKQSGDKFSVVAAYDATLARLASDAGIDIILVGDSLGMVVQGQDSTLPVTIEDMVYHTQSVVRGVKQSSNQPLIIADMPFATYANTVDALKNATQLMQAGANMVKLEGGKWLKQTVSELVRNGIPVCAHLGLTPQSVNVFSGYRVQAKTESEQNRLLAETQELESAGASLMVYECIPSELAASATESTSLCTIGIGAGSETNGQVLVAMDLLGTAKNPARFVKDFLASAPTPSISAAFEAFNTAVKNGTFPSKEHQY
jgi:3-methyl-2-oxobutanoate hydroxymethyltransferase